MQRSVIERAARALCRLDEHSENLIFKGKPMWASYVDQVRTVLRAVREPTDKMKEVGAIEGSRNDVDFRLDDRPSYGELDVLHQAEAREEMGIAFVGMIDAALSENP